MKRLSRTGIRVIVRSGLVWLALATAAGEEIHPPPSANHPLSVIYSEKLISDVDPNDARAATQFWITGLVKQRWPDAEATATILGSLEAIVKAVRENRGDIVALLPLDYLEIKDRVDLVPAYSPTVNGRPKASFSLLVRRDGPQTLDEIGRAHV